MTRTIKQRLQDVGLRLALRSLGKFKAGDRSGAALLSEDRRNSTVALVWALDQDGEQLSEEVSGQLEKLSRFGTVVVVCPPRYFGALRSKGLFFETLPAPSEIALCDITRDWDLYLGRRIVRIRTTWVPDFEFTIGQSPEDYLEAIRDVDQSPITG